MRSGKVEILTETREKMQESQWSLTFEVRKSEAFAGEVMPRLEVAMEPDL